MQNQSSLLLLFVKFKFNVCLSSRPDMLYIFPCYPAYLTLSSNPASQSVGVECVCVREGSNVSNGKPY